MFIIMILLSGIIAIISLCSMVDDILESFYTQHNERNIKFRSFQKLNNDEYDDTVRLIEDYKYFWN